MELLLNICWLALVLAAVLLQRREPHVARTRAVLALACAALLMFPAISITDDLHPSDGPFEDASKRTARTVPTPRVMPALPALAPVAVTCDPQIRAYEAVSEAVTRLVEDALLPPLPGRAPPPELA